MGDLPHLRRWRRALEVRPWWGEPHEQFELLRADLNEPPMKTRIVSFDERPFAYAQDYEVQGLSAGASDAFAARVAGDRQLRRLALDDRPRPWASLSAAARCSALRRRAAGGDRSGGRQCARGALTKRRAFASKPLVATEAGPAILMLYEPETEKVSSPSPVGLKRADDARRREVGREHELEATPEQPAVGMSKAGGNGRLALAAA